MLIDDRSAKWSEGVEGRHVTTGVRGESTGVIRRSRVLPLVWVEKVTCCLRLKSDKTDRNCATGGRDGMLQ